ncbi:MAG: hypothetical protein ACLQUY_18715 [Ktedonobacterales bacterium]
MSRLGNRQSRETVELGSPARNRRGAGRVIFNLVKPRWVRLGLVSALLLSVVVAVTLYVGPALASHGTARTARTAQVATFYGTSDTQVLAAVQAAGWPQQESNWCGVATVAAIARFHGQAVSQQDVANYLNSSAALSEWQPPYPPPSATAYWGPAFQADISGDDGTDPRSLAQGLTGLAGTPYHYHQLVDLGSNYQATLNLVYDVVRSQEPISVIVYHGLHSVLVSGVTATGNPLTDPASVTGLDVWDPGYGVFDGNIQDAQEVLVPLSTWLSSQYYWGSPYNANYYGTFAGDPDPSVGTPYTYDPSQGDYGHLWSGHYVYIRPDVAGDPAAGVSTDWAFSQTDALIEGFHGEVPSGYTGPTTSIPITTILPDTSIDGPALWTPSSYQLTSGSFDPVSVLAWTGTDGAHHLNVETSQDGINYQNKVILNETSFTRPSVIVVPTATSNVVVIAWTGTDSAHHLNVIYDVYGSPQKVILPEVSSYAPSLAYFGGQIWIAWTGNDSGQSLNVRALGPQGLGLGVKTTLAVGGSSAGPYLTTDPSSNNLLLSWQQRYAQRLDFVESSDGSNWNVGLPSPSPQTSPITPTMMAINPAPADMSQYYWAWTGTDGSHSLNVMRSSALNNWSVGVDTLPETSISAPELGFAGQPHLILVAWTGTDSAHHLNVAVLPV